MAAADYQLCNLCRATTYYDSDLTFDFDENPNWGLHNVGDMAVICTKCAETHAVQIVERAPTLKDPADV